jgi:hypothetical protein
MQDLSYIEQVKLALKSTDYLERLKVIYTLVEIGDINQEQFITLVNFSVDLDLIPTED